MALRQQPDHVVVPRLANVRARPITLFQLLNAEMIRHVRHARPLRFIAHQANCFAPPRESADSISRKPYYSRSTLSTTRITTAIMMASPRNIGSQGASCSCSGSTGQSGCALILCPGAESEAVHDIVT